MANVNDCIDSGESALNALYGLQTTAMKQGNLVAQKALKDDIDELTYKLTQLRRQQIADNDAQINALDAQLRQVTSSAQDALKNLDKMTAVLSDMIAATKVLDGILGAVSSA